MKKEEIEHLLGDHGTPCVSIIVPAHHISVDRRTDPRTLFNAAVVAKEMLIKNYRGATFLADVNKKIDDAVEQEDYIHTVNGIGIYVSPSVSQTVQFSIPVKEKVIIGHSFDSRDLLCELDSLHEYLVLAMSRKYIRLYKGTGAHLEEIKDGAFPFIYEETFEYSRPSLASSFGENTLKGGEIDKSELVEIRMQEFIRHADAACAKYLTGSLPLIISGDAKALSDYMEVTKHSGKVTGKVPGSYFDAGKQLAQLACQVFEDKKQENKKQLIARAREFVGKRLIAEGMEEVQRAALDGLGLNLLVEKDFVHTAQALKGGFEISDNGNAADLIIRSVMAKQGEVTFMEPGSLKEFNGIALMLRYNDR
ncbi:MAG: hypothetical protein HKL88_05985 [Bacteroidia bacterium]|jgi:hypothetical protein|nr:hypothetical protein [Bacteroidia bacterium]